MIVDDNADHGVGRRQAVPQPGVVGRGGRVGELRVLLGVMGHVGREAVDLARLPRTDEDPTRLGVDSEDIAALDRQRLGLRLPERIVVREGPERAERLHRPVGRAGGDVGLPNRVAPGRGQRLPKRAIGAQRPMAQVPAEVPLDDRPQQAGRMRPRTVTIRPDHRAQPREFVGAAAPVLGPGAIGREEGGHVGHQSSHAVEQLGGAVGVPAPIDINPRHRVGGEHPESVIVEVTGAARWAVVVPAVAAVDVVEIPPHHVVDDLAVEGEPERLASGVVDRPEKRPVVAPPLLGRLPAGFQPARDPTLLGRREPVPDARSRQPEGVGHLAGFDRGLAETRPDRVAPVGWVVRIGAGQDRPPHEVLGVVHPAAPGDDRITLGAREPAAKAPEHAGDALVRAARLGVVANAVDEEVGAGGVEVVGPAGNEL